ncbi:hypothetical protein [Streptomyces sp. HD]|uniref:hypothetical protein n=1 Tax=Streptomyces sp. HD TaxID=3020892 RepID=UPI0023314CA9|nr:hypothetical protein [Streptomyces sp. HD]MDC0770908.1 hypothetical protein [Streptomyces sp. HD]
MITRRTFMGAAAGTGLLVLADGALVPGSAAAAPTDRRWSRDRSANGWRIAPAAIGTHRIQGTTAKVALHTAAASVLLHVARRWHYEIAPLDTGEGGGVTGHTTSRVIGADFESNHLSGTAIALHPTAYPLGGSERLWPHQEAVVRDILADCEGIVTWGADLTPVKASHFHLNAGPGSRALAKVATRLDTSRHSEFRTQTAGAVADPATPARLAKSRRVQRIRTR